jgi:hypothetical protein
MELIEIIFTILILSSAFLLIVILVSYIFSRIKRDETNNIKPSNNLKPTYNKYNYQNQVPPLIRNNIHNPQPIIFHVDQFMNRDTKIVRKQTFSGRDIQGSLRLKSTNSSPKNPFNGSRYKIINEELNKDQKPFVVNFYQ